ncbi:hypothetical protein Rsub_09165 [Raphidocelis subcapitata]|uniref:Hydroxylysine kinase n=1 Tax=Raphidocelis subcapitata TaxID=307507 RepID=A0A2V0PCB8_9CHLO|nr:hypothetical protein Rsub_09165 [Raphidocelis subcapitata]|eukprot:GBF96582.1 hypothetical protein Rsub_09165 [Raphidocelis subcapitata]
MHRITAEDARALLPLFQPFAHGGGGSGGTGARSGAAAPPFAAAARIDRLAGYDDANFRIRFAGGNAGTEAFAWVLKIHNPADSAAHGQPGGAMDAQNGLMLFVAPRAAAAGLRCNRPIAVAGGGGCVATVQLHGRAHSVRMLEFLPGRVLGAEPQSPQLQREIGATAARLSGALHGFDHPALHGLEHDWSLECVAATLRRKLPQVPASVFQQWQRDLVEAAVARFEAALARAGGPDLLPRQVCHTDLNEQNLLCDETRSKVVGVLDWGDAGYCWRVVEVAVAAAYAMIVAAGPAAPDDHGTAGGGGGGVTGGGTGSEGGGAPAGNGSNGSSIAGGEDHDGAGPVLAAGRRVVEGYLAAGGPLTDGERDLLPALAAARVAQSLTNGAVAAGAAPENSAYLLTTQRTGWGALRALLGLDEGALSAALLPAPRRGAAVAPAALAV